MTDNPQAALAAALVIVEWDKFYTAEGLAGVTLAALDGWHLERDVATADWTGSTRKDAEIARLNALVMVYQPVYEALVAQQDNPAVRALLSLVSEAPR